MNEKTEKAASAKLAKQAAELLPQRADLVAKVVAGELSLHAAVIEDRRKPSLRR